MKSIFENKVENKALVDSRCPELVAGLIWLRNYEISKEVKRSDTFKMGKEVFKTVMFKVIPVKIRTYTEDIEVGIIDTEIPLLIYKRKLKEWGLDQCGCPADPTSECSVYLRPSHHQHPSCLH